MANRTTIYLTSDASRDLACSRVLQAPNGWLCRVAEPTRTDLQNKLMWPLIADMQAQIPEMATHSAEDVKLRFLHALGSELRFLPDLENVGLFPVGQRSSTLSKSQFSALIELMFAHGAKHDVRWSKKSETTRAAILQSQVDQSK